MEDIIAQHVAEFILGIVTLFTAIVKYREVIQFFWPAIKWFGKPLTGIAKWVKMPYSVSAQQAVDGDKIKGIEVKLDDLISFTKNKLSPNGGSSISDALKRLENHLQVREQFQYAIMQDTNLGYFKCDTKGHNEWVNRTYARFLGCGTQELLGLGWKKFIRAKELERYNHVWQQAFTDSCEFDDVVEFVNSDGHTVILKISVTAMYGLKGDLLGYVGQVVAL